MVFTTNGFFEVAIESWPEWDLNPQPLNSVQMLSLDIYIIQLVYLKNKTPKTIYIFRTLIKMSNSTKNNVNSKSQNRLHQHNSIFVKNCFFLKNQL